MSSDVVTPHLDDPLVWEMADRNHVPREHWNPKASWVTCGECGQPWRCATRRALDAMLRPEPNP